MYTATLPLQILPFTDGETGGDSLSMVSSPSTRNAQARVSGPSPSSLTDEGREWRAQDHCPFLFEASPGYKKPCLHQVKRDGDVAQIEGLPGWHARTLGSITSTLEARSGAGL